ncbi:o-succinylbenzoate synthase [Geminocystis sp. GBBB08]|uniref:o-succinylbenzoate synthase n=1 Tax=Geminocystis sp. GBBB08 TaxID=2604140 RepID=UPI0027E2DC94|nr:o-succinylbenzoate synthase [Geminocystis sp. GBBB08]MBL1208797.1 o-succinylbenzoate synthase [Geminocystis sp. GBBB08]
MKIEQIELYNLSIPFIFPFKFSNGELLQHTCLIVAVKSEGEKGWGECPTFDNPYYTYETISTASHILKDFLIPKVIGKKINRPQEIRDLLAPIRGHNMAKSALDCAIYDLFAKFENVSLRQYLGGVKDKIKVGVSVSLEGDINQLLDKVESYVNEGYQRVKLKISPHWNLQPLQEVRKKYPDLLLMADANSAFTLDDVALFQAMDELNLTMIEQPLAYDDLLGHSTLQRQINTPICLDESINSLHDTKLAIALKSAEVINLKVSRVGGITNAIEIHDLCEKAGIKLWCGGMLESGIGRATNLHLASLRNFVYPADISATNRYFLEDITQPTVYLNSEDSTINVPTNSGIGVEVNKNLLLKYSHYRQVFR